MVKKSTQTGRLYVVPLLGWLILVLAGTYPTYRLSGGAAIRDMLLAQAVVVAVIYATLWPAVQRMQGADAALRLKIVLKIMVTRFMFTLAVALAVAWRGSVDRVVFLIWVAITYVILVKVETFVLIRWFRKLEISS